MIRFKGIHHPAFVTRDMEKTVRFWRDLVGMRLIYTSGGKGDRQAFFDAGERNRLVFFEFPDAQSMPRQRHGEPKKGACIFDHVAIAVDGDEALWELMGRLEAADMPFSDVVDHGFCHSLYSYDPNGIPIEFLSPAPDVDLDAEPRFNDRDPIAVTREGAEPQRDHWPEPEEIPEDERQVVPGAGHEEFPKNDVQR